MQVDSNTSNRSPWPSLIFWAGLTCAAATFGAQFAPDRWYRELAKPSFNPPDAVFGPVWTVLYALMAIAVWLVWRRRRQANVWPAVLLFVVQLGLNAAWSWLFFGRHEIGLALVDIVALWLALVATTAAFWRVHGLAGGLLLPYLAWVSFATALNFAFWRLNA